MPDAVSVPVAELLALIEGAVLVEGFNPYHDKAGRFSPRPGRGASVAAKPTNKAKGTPVSGRITIEGEDDLMRPGVLEVKQALRVIDQVHGDGNLPSLPLRTVEGDSARGDGEFLVQFGHPQEILVNGTGAHPEYSTLHEVGHFLDYSGLSGGIGDFASAGITNDMHIRRWGNAALKSEAIKTIRDYRKRLRDQVPNAKDRTPLQQKNLDYSDYLLDTPEVFARSYAQWVATRSGNDYILGQLREKQARARTSKGKDVWEDADFEPIGAALDALFEARGWRKAEGKAMKSLVLHFNPYHDKAGRFTEGLGHDRASLTLTGEAVSKGKVAVVGRIEGGAEIRYHAKLERASARDIQERVEEAIAPVLAAIPKSHLSQIGQVTFIRYEQDAGTHTATTWYSPKSQQSDIELNLYGPAKKPGYTSPDAFVHEVGHAVQNTLSEAQARQWLDALGVKVAPGLTARTYLTTSATWGDPSARAHVKRPVLGPTLYGSHNAAEAFAETYRLTFFRGRDATPASRGEAMDLRATDDVPSYRKRQERLVQALKEILEAG